jgi:hypothetical protein
MRMLDRMHRAVARKLPDVDHYRRLFQNIRPGVVFSSQQAAPEILAPVLAAKSLGIPTASFIFSWDNLSSKGRIAAPFDHFLVWSDHMGQELMRFYRDITEQCVHIVGTPQFDPYADASLLWSRDEYCRRVGADPQRPIICYSGGDPGNAKEDPQHLDVLLRQIRAGQIRQQPQVLLRSGPSDPGTRYAQLRSNYPELIFVPPVCYHTRPGDWRGVIPQAEDIQLLANLIRHADLNINFASTMTLDFAIYDKPVINVAFDVSSPPHFNMPMWDYYQKWDHYRPVIEFAAARFARSPDELADHVNAYLDDPTLDREGRAKFRQQQISVPIGNSTEEVLSVLQQISSDRQIDVATPHQLATQTVA